MTVNSQVPCQLLAIGNLQFPVSIHLLKKVALFYPLKGAKLDSDFEEISTFAPFSIEVILAIRLSKIWTHQG